eukprot:scaffold244546_cov31-Tisochrysis_lutea.AAC.1
MPPPPEKERSTVRSHHTLHALVLLYTSRRRAAQYSFHEREREERERERRLRERANDGARREGEKKKSAAHGGCERMKGGTRD